MPLNVALLMVIALLAGGISLAKKAGGPPADYAIQVQVYTRTCIYMYSHTEIKWSKCKHTYYPCNNVQESSIDDVPKYGTVIQFSM